jgi:N utilization substance protein B
MKRRDAREKAVQALYQIDMRKIPEVEAIHSVTSEGIEPNDLSFLQQLVEGVVQKQDEIDQRIVQYLRGWSLDRLALVERAILRIAAYEILYIDEIPNKVSLNEAIDLARAFSTDKSAKFINGVLNSIVQELAGKPEGAVVRD